YLCGRNGNVSDVQLTVFTAGERAGFFHRFIDPLQQIASFLEEKFSFCRERYAARAAAQKVDADLILEVLHLSAQCRLRYSKTRGRFSEIQDLTHHLKVAQVS